VKIQNWERVHVQSTSVVDFNSTNMLDVSTIRPTLYHVFKATPPFTDCLYAYNNNQHITAYCYVLVIIVQYSPDGATE